MIDGKFGNSIFKMNDKKVIHEYLRVLQTFSLDYYPLHNT